MPQTLRVRGGMAHAMPDVADPGEHLGLLVTLAARFRADIHVIRPLTQGVQSCPTRLGRAVVRQPGRWVDASWGVSRPVSGWQADDPRTYQAASPGHRAVRALNALRPVSWAMGRVLPHIE